MLINITYLNRISNVRASLNKWGGCYESTSQACESTEPSTGQEVGGGGMRRGPRRGKAGTTMLNLGPGRA